MDRLPLALILDIIEHLDLFDLVKVLQAFPKLINLVAVFTDFIELAIPSIQSRYSCTGAPHIKETSLRELFPSIAVHHWSELSKPRFSGAYVKVVELRLGWIGDHRDSLEQIDYECYIDYGFAPTWVVCNILRSVCSSYLNERSFVRLMSSARGFDIRHSSLQRACMEKGAKFHHSQVQILGFLPTKVTLHKDKQLWDHLESLHIHGKYHVHLPILPRAVSVFVELEPAPDMRRPVLIMDSALRLSKLIVHYRGPLVPELSLSEDVFNFRLLTPDRSRSSRVCGCFCESCGHFGCSRAMFELKRNWHAREGITDLYHDKGTDYNLSSLSFTKSCCSMTLDGVPDWVLLKVPNFVCWGGLFVWKRWSFCGLLNMEYFQAEIPDLYYVAKLHFLTDIEGYKLPFVTMGLLEDVSIYTTAYGLDLDWFLASIHLSQSISITISCPPYQRGKEPLVLKTECFESNDMKENLKALHIQGHVLIEFLALEALRDRKPFRCVRSVILDLSATISTLCSLNVMGNLGQPLITIDSFFNRKTTKMGYIQLECPGVDAEYVMALKPIISVSTRRKNVREVIVDSVIQRCCQLSINGYQARAPEHEGGFLSPEPVLHRWICGRKSIRHIPLAAYTLDQEMTRERGRKRVSATTQ